MTEVAEHSTPGHVGPALLPLKLAPPARSEALLRPDLQALLAEVRLRAATLVVAPAGYGKTTLLAQWAAELDRTGASVCWLGLDATDQAPALLLAYLVRSFQRHHPEVGEQAWRVLHSAADLERDWPLVAGALLSDLQSELQSPTFLIVDDFHLIADGPITAPLLGYLLRAAPPALHIIVASRRPVAFAPLPRLRAEGELVEVERRDLSLARDEAAELLARAGVTLDDADLDLLLDRTEGWVLSLQLAARALARQASAQRRPYIESLGMGQRGIFDYLASEVMAELPPTLLDGLTRAALADEVDAALLAEVLGRADAGTLLEQAQQLGLPITTVDAEGRPRSYRLHPLWLRLLRDRAAQQIPAAERADLHRRFGLALERQGRLEQALAQYDAAGDSDNLARALRERAWPLIDTPQRTTIRAWIERLPPGVRDADPELMHMWGWSVAAAAGEEALAAISRAAAIYHSQGNYQRELRGLSDMAALLFWEDRPADFAAVCVRAVGAANRVRDAWARGTALVSVVALLYSRGRYGAALRVAAQAARHPRSAFWQWLLAMTVASIQIQQGYPAAALSTISAALEIPQVDRDDRLRQNLLRLQAAALGLQGQVGEAVAVALEAYQRLSDYTNEGAIGSSAALLAQLLLEQGRLEEANTYLARAGGVGNRIGAPALLTRVRVLDAYALLRADQAPQAAAAASDVLRQLRPSSAEQPSQRGPLLREILPDSDVPYASLATHDLWMQLLLLIALGEGGEAQRAATLADDLVAEMERRGDGLFLSAVSLYRAALAARRGDDTLREAALRQGWGLAELHGFGYLPALPAAVIEGAAADALRLEIAPRMVGEVLRRQTPGSAVRMLLSMLEDQNGSPTMRARVAALLGDLGAAAAFPALRALLKERHPNVRSAAEGALERLVYRPAYKLIIRTLGGFGVWRGEIEIRDRDWRSVKARQLLQLLLVERGRMLPRDRIMDMLWPGLEAEAAANNLRVTLSRLTKAIEPTRPEGAPTYYIVQQGDTYGFNVESDHAYDAAEFSSAVDQARGALQRGQRGDAHEHLQRAIKFYGGTFLPDCLYEDWSVVERERLALLFTEASLALGDMLLGEGQPHEAIGLAWRVLEYDQAQEEAYQLLMRAYAELGERSTALRLYSRCVQVLESELGVEPLPETLELYERIRNG
jgi:ATP/maltotriose-dependent transcriptional regulator MalT/DNA-binding SARP family transcriptional activator